MKTAFKHIAIIGKYMHPEMREQIIQLAHFLRTTDATITIEQNTADNCQITDFNRLAMAEICELVDLVVVLGGDGTMLSVARALGASNIPLIGINRGRLGFLTDLTSESMFEGITQILAGNYSAEKRMLLNATVLSEGVEAQSFVALNDVVVGKSNLGRLIELEVYINSDYVNRQRSDGLIVSTPTGTTAYSLSAGGPILDPSLNVITLVPICPHTLSNRPIAISGSSEVLIQVVGTSECSVHFDGQSALPLKQGDKVQIRSAKNTVTLLHPQGHNHYATLREKLGWG